MAASTAPAVKSALLTLLAADSGLSGVQIEYADPGAEIAQESIFFGRTIETEKPSPGMRGNNLKQRESYDLELWVYAAADGNDPQTVEERCWTLVGRVEAVVSANNTAQGTLGVTLVPGGWVVMAGIEMTPFTVNGQRVAEAKLTIHAEAIK